MFVLEDDGRHLALDVDDQALVGDVRQKVGTLTHTTTIVDIRLRPHPIRWVSGTSSVDGNRLVGNEGSKWDGMRRYTILALP